MTFCTTNPGVRDTEAGSMLVEQELHSRQAALLGRAWLSSHVTDHCGGSGGKPTATEELSARWN